MPTNDELNPENIDDNDPQAPSQLRAAYERANARARAAEGLEREVALLRLGIDTGTTLGKAFLATYEGDIKNAEAVLEAAKEFPGIIRGQAAPATQDDPSATTGTQVTTPDPAGSAPAPTGTDQRRALANGATPSAAATRDPVEDAHARAADLLTQGRSRDEAMAEAVANLSRAVFEGNMQAIDAFGRPVQ